MYERNGARDHILDLRKGFDRQRAKEAAKSSGVWVQGKPRIVPETDWDEIPYETFSEGSLKVSSQPNRIEDIVKIEAKEDPSESFVGIQLSGAHEQGNVYIMGLNLLSELAREGFKLPTTSAEMTNLMQREGLALYDIPAGEYQKELLAKYGVDSDEGLAIVYRPEPVDSRHVPTLRLGRYDIVSTGRRNEDINRPGRNLRFIDFSQIDSDELVDLVESGLVDSAQHVSDPESTYCLARHAGMLSDFAPSSGLRKLYELLAAEDELEELE